MDAADWTDRVRALWDAFDHLPADEFLAQMHELVGQRPDSDAVAHYELGSAFDSTDHETQAAEEYERAFALELPEELRRQATIQYASTLRNLGRAHEAVSLLEAERARISDSLDDAVTTFLAFALVDAGQPDRAVGEATAALGAHLPRYQRSVAEYARELRERSQRQ